MSKNITIITEPEGKKIVLINDIRFKGKTREEWKEIEDYNSKHGVKAKFGWYRYDTRLALPVYNDEGEIQRYNIYKLRMLVRHAEDGKLYLYDFLRTKKEMSSPLK